MPFAWKERRRRSGAPRRRISLYRPRGRTSPHRRDRPQSCTKRVERAGRPIPAIGDDAGDRPRVRDVLERIRAQDHEIGDASSLDAAVVRRLPEKRAGLIVAVCSASSGVNPAATNRCSSRCRLMPGVTSTPAGVSVPARNGTPRHVQLLHDVELVFDEALGAPRADRRPCSARIDFCDAGYFFSIHVRGVYAMSGSFVKSIDVDEPLPALPEQRRALPDVVLRETAG